MSKSRAKMFSATVGGCALFAALLLNVVHPDSLRIRTAQFKGIRKLLEQASIERISVELHHTDNAAHTDE